ncbi:MAG TPA: primary-amine oxidase [Gemmatimonadaceae bacterium]|nr:primary-amine oxidase [Gemmatimonadaceae bacterium]
MFDSRRTAPQRRSRQVLIAMVAAVACGRSAPPHRDALDPLDAREMRAARQALLRSGLLSGSTRVMLLDVREPPKADVLAHRAVTRGAFAVLYDPARNLTREVVVDLAGDTIQSAREVPGVEPALDGVDAGIADAIVRGDSTWRAALARRGISPSEVAVLAWSAGQFGEETPSRGRLVRGLTYMRPSTNNEMARPVEGLVALVDLSGRRVLRVDDTAAAPVPTRASETGAWRALAPPTTPESRSLPWSSALWQGAGPDISGYRVAWRRWRFHVASRPREGIVLHAVGFDDGTRVRSVLYRASLSEMVVPYGDPGAGWYFRNTFDAGELGLGVGASSLRPGVDCPANATFIDAVVAAPDGNPRRIPRAIAIYERDGGLAWKHADASRRARALVVFGVSHMGNYDYGFEWVFHEDGTIAHRVLLTGVMAAKAVGASHADSSAHAVAPNVAAVDHQHFFNYRLDLDVDGAAPNQVDEIETQAVSVGPGNPHGGGFTMQRHVLARETEARRSLDSRASRRWTVVNTAVHNALGEPTGYALVPGTNAESFAAPDSPIRRRAGFLDAQIWVTAYADSERFAAGDYPNQAPGGDGLVTWTEANRSLVGGDVVLWYTLGVTHNPRPEDWPVMPVHEAGFSLVPVGFFDRNPLIGSP